MGKFTERLALIIDADGQGAIRELSKVGDSAKRELGAAEERAAKARAALTTYGSTAVVAAATATGALAKLGVAAGNLNETTSATRVIFGDAADGLDQFARSAASIGLSRREALDAVNTFGTLAKAADLTGDNAARFSERLTRLAADLASFRNTTPADAIDAIGQALRGENEAIRRYGVLLDDATLRQRAFDEGLVASTTETLPPAIKVQAAYAEIVAQTSDAQGDAVRTGDSYANQQRQLAANAANLAAGLGKGVLPALTSVVSTANAGVGAFSGLSDGTQQAVGTIATIGVAAVGAVGALSVMAGQADKLRDRFTDAEGALTAFGRGATVIGGIAALAIGTEVTITAIDELTGSTRNLNAALAEAAQAKDAAAALAAFQRATQLAADGLTSQNIAQGVIDAFSLGIGEESGAERLVRAQRDNFDALLSANVPAAERIVDALRAQGEEVGDLQAKIDGKRKADVQAIQDQRQYATELDAATDALNGQTAATETASVTMAEWSEELKTSIADVDTATRELTRAQQDLERLRRGGVAEVQARAELQLRGALLASADAADRARDAERRLDRQRREDATGLTRDRLELDRAEALERLLDAQALGGSGDPLDFLRAGVGTKEATLDLEDADRALTDFDAGVRETTDAAQRAVAQALVNVDQQAFTVIDARRNMTDAVVDYQRAVEDAARRELDLLAQLEEATERRIGTINQMAGLAQDRLYSATVPGPGATYGNPDGPQYDEPLGPPLPPLPGLGNRPPGGGDINLPYGIGVPGMGGVTYVTITIDGSNLTPSQIAEEIDRKGSFLAGSVKRF